MSGIAFLFLALAIATFTIGSTNTPRTIHKFGSVGVSPTHYTAEIYFIRQRFSVSVDRMDARPRVKVPESSRMPSPTMRTWGSHEFPTFLLSETEMSGGLIQSRYYSFVTTGHSLLLGVVIPGLYPALSLIRGPLRRQSRRRRGLCLTCGYNMVGSTTGSCPECGRSPRTKKLSLRRCPAQEACRRVPCQRNTH